MTIRNGRNERVVTNHLQSFPAVGSYARIDHFAQSRRNLQRYLEYQFPEKILVLCGHKHRPWLWDFNNLLIANAGSTSSERVRGFFENSYNIIKIEDGNISIDLKVVGGERRPLESVVSDYTRFEEE